MTSLLKCPYHCHMVAPHLHDYEDDNRQSWTEKLLFPVRAIHTKKLAAALRNKTILITGASYGIGASLARLCSHYPAKLILVARTTERLQALAEECKNRPCSISIFTTDLREEGHINHLLQNLHGENIKVDIFISNAGKSIYRKLEESVDRFHDTKRTAATNYTGPVQLLLGLLPGLQERHGHIINISAVNVLLPPAVGWSAYQSSKTAFDQWLRCMEPELKAKEVNISSLYLPLVRTKMSMVNAEKHRQPAMSKEKAVRLAARYLIHKKRKYTPWWLGMVTFCTALFPNLFYRIQLRRIKRA